MNEATARQAEQRTDDQRCPVCGEGVVADIAFDAHHPEGQIEQGGRSRQLVTYTCGHDVVGPRLEAADSDRMDVEKRRTEDTV